MDRDCKEHGPYQQKRDWWLGHLFSHGKSSVEVLAWTAVSLLTVISKFSAFRNITKDKVTQNYLPLLLFGLVLDHEQRPCWRGPVAIVQQSR